MSSATEKSKALVVIHKPHAWLLLKCWTQITEGHATFDQRLLETERTAAHWDKTSKHQPQMYAISNMVDIWGAKVHKLAIYYGWSKMAGGKPKLNNYNGVLFRAENSSLYPGFKFTEGWGAPNKHLISAFWYWILSQTMIARVCACPHVNFLTNKPGGGTDRHTQRVPSH